MSKPANFSELLAPISQETFFAEYWETKPLHISRADSAFYASLVTVRELDDLITSGHLRYPGLQIAKGGQYVAPEVYTQNIRSGGENFTGILDLDRVSLEYQAGATITLPALQRVSKNIGDLACALESELDHAVQANAYLTPGGATGFTPHYDTHEVFILQIGGEKHWCIYEPPIKLPHRSQPFTPENYSLPATPLLEVDLHAGDLLYLPRGHIHATSALSSYSAHVTIAVTVYTWIELVTEFLQVAKSKPEFRKALPAGFTSNKTINLEMAAHFFQLLGKLQVESNGEDLLHRFSKRVRSGRARSVESFHSNKTVIGMDTAFTVQGFERFIVSERDGGIQIDFDEKKVTLPIRARVVVDEICKRISFRLRDLSHVAEGEVILLVLRRLLGCGILRPTATDNF